MTASEEFTPAVERAAELLIREAETTGLIRDDVRNGLAVALTDTNDPDDIARVLYVLHWSADGHTSAKFALSRWDVAVEETRVHWRKVANGLRSHILGGAS